MGSSSNKMSGFTKRARARATRTLQPPDRLLIGLDNIWLVKPRPDRMVEARDSALCASISSNFWLIWVILSAEILFFSPYSSSIINLSLSTSVSSTVCSTLLSVCFSYCSTSRICRCLGIFGNSPLARAFIKQVLPIPFLPTRPYFLPYPSFT